ncbi:MAG: formylmethanofuran dehydrogenase [Chloroflexota bacterium]|nr:MAG: formylmethanofuran dehydrogenase [Chloroflexota bacterium]
MAEALARLNGLHEHLCPRQVLGVRIGLLAARELGFDVPLIDRRIHVVVETDGCFADGVTAATGCAIGHRTLRAIDYGKIAATLVDSGTGRAVRVWPSPDARCLARDYAADAGDRWHAQLTAYQAMPDEALLRWQTGTVAMAPSFSAIHPPPRVACEVCGEEIMGGRELTLDDRVFCRACSDGSYFAAD